MTNQYTIHLPTHYNDGTSIDKQGIDMLLDYALTMFGGYTYDRLHVEGAWVSDTGKTYKESMTRLYIATDNHDGVLSLCKQVCKALNQECVYMVQSGEVQFIS